MRAVTLHDLVIGRSHFGVDGPQISQDLQSLPDDHLRVNGDAVISVKNHAAAFFVDESGTKHIHQHMPEWQEVVCAWDAELIREGDAWRAPTDADRLNEAKVHKRRQVNELRDLLLSTPFEYAFPDAVPGSIDVRDQRDLTNMQALVTSAQLLFEQGVDASVIPFRDAEDQTHIMTPAEVKEMGMAVTQHQTAIYEASWVHKDAIKAAIDQAALDVIDITTGWPV